MAVIIFILLVCFLGLVLTLIEVGAVGAWYLGIGVVVWVVSVLFSQERLGVTIVQAPITILLWPLCVIGAFVN